MTLAGLAPAKINLFLHVTGRRPDGYHLLDSLAVFAGAADRLEAAPDDTLRLEITGDFALSLAVGADNLVLRAARALRDAAGIAQGARLTLEKNLPVASGIGGGSADAAAALRLLNRLWGLDLPRPELARIAGDLGADVPVCLACTPARMGGIGEVLGAAPALPEFHLVLVNPGMAVPTAPIFAARAGGFTPPARLPDAWPDADAMAADLAGLRNDLQPPAIALFPAIGEALAALAAQPGCRLARMSGSGATCFGLFATAAAAAKAAQAVAWPGWWVWAGQKERPGLCPGPAKGGALGTPLWGLGSG